MKKILGIFKKRWFWTLLILIVLSLAIWFGGPYVVIADEAFLAPEINRLIGIIILVLLWGLDNLIFGGKKKDDDDEEEEPEPEPEPEPEIDQDAETAKRDSQTLANRFKKFVAVFNAAHGARQSGRRKLYTLPWYLVIGTNDSGKSEFLANSGQPFPLAKELYLDTDNVQATESCDWWISDQAVFIDTAGRLTEQSAPTIDNPVWMQLLAQIRKYRPRRPLNGVIVTVDLSSIMIDTPAQLAGQADSIKRRLNDISRRLGTLYPIYVVFTKVDKVAGALEFFDNLGRDERDQLFGITLPELDNVRMGTFKHKLDEEFDSLMQRLNDRLLARLQDERNPAKRSLVYGFPQRIAGLRKPLLVFLSKVFSVDRYHEPQMLRGIYFTSARQQGAPIDPLANTVAEEYAVSRAGLVPYTGKGRSFFIKNLVHKLIFAEQAVAGVNRREQTVGLAVRMGLIIGGLIAVGGMSWLWYNAAQQNQTASENMAALLQVSQQQLDRASNSRNPADLRPALETLNKATYRFHPEEDSMLVKLGLYQGEALHTNAKQTYGLVLRQELLSRVQDMAKFRMQEPGTDLQVLLDALRVYLMLGQPDRLDAEVVIEWFNLEWQRRYPDNVRERAPLEKQLKIAFTYPAIALEQDQRAIAQARKILLQLSPAERIYNYIKQSAKKEFPGRLHFVRAGAPNLFDVFALQEASDTFGSIANLYTYEGFHNYFLDKSYSAAERSAEEEWVLGLQANRQISNSDIEKVAGEIRSLYFSDYIANWQAALLQLNTRKAGNLTELKSLISKMADENSPILKLLSLVQYHTTLYRAPPPEEGGGDPAASGVQAGRILGGTAGRAAAAVNKVGRVADAVGASDFTFSQNEGIGNRVNEAFSGIHAILEAAEGQDPEMTGIMSSLRDVSDTVSAITVAPSPGSEALTFAKTRMLTSKNDIITALRERAKVLPSPLNRWFDQTADNAWGVVLTTAHSELARLWKIEVYRVYGNGLKGRYPLDRYASNDIPLSDFSSFFGPGGTIDDFVAKHLDPFIDDQIWKASYRDGRALPISRKTLKALANASVIKNTFFSDGSSPSLQFAIKPLTLDGSINQAMLEIEGQQSVYYHGPQRDVAIAWPGEAATNLSRIVFQEIDSSKPLTKVARGPWSWFRLLDTARIRSLSRDRFQIIFEISGREARYLLTATSVTNPFGTTNPLNINLPESF